MSEPRRSPWIKWSLMLGPWVLLAAAIGGSTTAAFDSFLQRHSPPASHRVATVRREDLSATLVAGGRVESGNKTLIECELEQLEVRSGGSSLSTNGSSIILDVLPEGTDVKKGDVLCRLDDSGYEELVRLQQIQVEASRTVSLQAQLTMEVAETALREYQEGLRLQIVQDFKGQIALAQADLMRAENRLAWTERMQGQGYAAVAQVANDKSTVMKARFALSQLEREYQQFLKFGDKSSVAMLESQVSAARVSLVAGTESLKLQEGRLAHYRQQLENCTIRAPHDGFLIYAHDDDDDERIDAGLFVRSRQDLFYLPDLEQLEVHAMLHESIVYRVREGMTAEVQVEARPGETLTGRVVSISWLPLRPRGRFRASEVMNFLARVKLDAIPPGLRIGMSAEVRINLGPRRGVLAVPAEAITVEDGREVCSVATPQGVERREVETLPAQFDLLEVTEGLEEGEEVILGPVEDARLGAS